MDNSSHNSSTSKNTSSSNAMGLSSLLAWCFAFGFMDLMVFTANFLTLLVFYSSKRLLRKRHNHFLILLAITDILVGLIVMPLYIYQLVSWWSNNNNVLQNALFNTFTAMDILSGFASIFTLTAIATDRVYAIVFPFYHKTAPRGVYPCMIAFVWILSGLLVVYYILSHVHILPKEAFIYLLLFSILLSLVVICVSYILVWLRVKCFKLSHRLKGASFREKRLAEMLFLVTVVFLLTWLPFYAMNFIYHFCKSSACRPSPTLVQFSKLLHYSNSFLNPIIYSYRNAEFKKVLENLLKRLTSHQSSTVSLKKQVRPTIGIRRKQQRLLLERQEAFRHAKWKESRV